MIYLLLVAFLIPALVHCVGIYLLLKVKAIADDRPQFWHILSFSCAELSYSLHRVVYGIIETFELVKDERTMVVFLLSGQLGLLLFLGLIKFVITVDRFMEIFLHLRYPLLYSAEKARRLIGILVGLCFLAYIIAAVRIKTIKEMRAVLALYLWPLLGAKLIVSSFCLYIYIHWTHSHRRPVVLPSRNSIQGSRRTNHRRKLLLLPTLLIASFYIFGVLPALIIFISNLHGKPANSGTTFIIVNSFLMIMIVVNVIAYVLVYPPIKRFILLRRARLLQIRRTSIFIIQMVIACMVNNDYWIVLNVFTI